MLRLRLRLDFAIRIRFKTLIASLILFGTQLFL
jgi:hypothetical protein